MSGMAPGLHAILIGVSAYDPTPPLQLGNPPRPFAATALDGPARTVAALYDWLTSPLTQLTIPLRKVTLLASPSVGEQNLIQALPNCKPATTANVVEALRGWQTAASLSRGDATFFYFAGHGIQRSATDSVMLLQDFNLGGTLLERSISLLNVYGGMGSTRGLPELARTQWYFADCCRSAVASLHNYETAPTAQVFDVEAELADDRHAPIFQAANSGNETYTPQTGQCTAFGSDLLRCVSGVGATKRRVLGQARWLVNANSLNEGMSYLTEEYNTIMSLKVEKWNQEHPADRISKTFRRTPVTTIVSNPVLCYLTEDPLVPCAFEPQLSVSPALPALVELELGPSGARPLPKHVPPFIGLNPLVLRAGYYDLGATLLDPPPPGARRTVSPQPVWVSPPACIMDTPT